MTVYGTTQRYICIYFHIIIALFSRPAFCIQFVVSDLVTLFNRFAAIFPFWAIAQVIDIESANLPIMANIGVNMLLWPQQTHDILVLVLSLLILLLTVILTVITYTFQIFQYLNNIRLIILRGS